MSNRESPKVNIVQLTPGAGAMYCGNCLRDNALVHTLRQMGHNVLMVPLYLPLTLDEPDESAGTPIFFSGISVYLEQQSALFRHAPAWFHQLLSSRKLLELAAGKAAKTRAADVGEMTLSMLRGEEGNQARELDKLIEFLKTQPKADVICLSNLLLSGMIRQLRSALGAKVVCFMQGEDSFLDQLPESHRAAGWRKVGENAAHADLLVSTSHYYVQRMKNRLGALPGNVRVVYSGISLEGYPEPGSQSRAGRTNSQAAAGEPGAAGTESTPVLGFFARMCREKGLDTVVEAYMLIRQSGRFPNLKLRVGGSCGPSDEPLVAEMKSHLRAQGLLHDVEFCPNLDRAAKIRFLCSLSVFSVPARYGEAYGLYLVEAMAAGVPVVQPRAAAFPELVEFTGGGLLCEPESPASLAAQIEKLLGDRELRLKLGTAGQQAVREHLSVEAAAHSILETFQELAGKPSLS